MSSQIEQIKDRINIVDLVSSYIEIKRHGTYYRSACPFHNEKSPSFFVSPTRGTYHCFGCGVHGDIFSFVENMDGVSFYEALKTLAEKAGVVLEKNFDTNKTYKDSLTKTLELSNKFFVACLDKKRDVEEYLNKRGITHNTIVKFEIGYSPLAGTRLVDFLKKKGVSEKEMIDAGMVIKTQGGVYERFRGRIMFPIYSAGGKVVGFSGRILVDRKDKSGNPVAKYINSPETEVYSKKNILYGYDKAKVDILRKKEVIVVEGQMDLVMSHQSGYENTVAVSGTALTKEHLSILKRTAESIVFCFDADSAGVKATQKAYIMAVEEGFDVKVLSLPKGEDPADIIKKDPEMWSKILSDKKNIVDFLIEYILSLGKETKDLVREVSSIVLPYVKALKSPMEKDYYVKKISQSTGLTEASVREELDSKTPALNIAASPTEASVPTLPSISNLRKMLFATYQYLGGAHTELREDFASSISSYISTDELETGFANLSDKEKEEYLFRSEIFFGENTKDQIDKLVRSMLLETLSHDVDQKTKELHELERKKDLNAAEKVLAEISIISKRLEELKAKR